MSKAFLLLALALVIAMVAAADNLYVPVAKPAEIGACKDLGYWAAGNFWIKNGPADGQAWIDDDTTGPCAEHLGVTTAALVQKQIAAVQPNACWTATAPGADKVCGIATGDACDATKESNVCVADNQCNESKCAFDVRIVFKGLPAEAKDDATITTAVQAALDAITAKVEGEDVKVCEKDLTAFKVKSKQVEQSWALISFSKIDTACKTALVTEFAKYSNVQGAECEVCAPWFETLAATCPCIYPEYIFSRATYTLLEGKKQSELEKFFKGAKDELKCTKATQFISAGDNKVVVQSAVKYKNKECDARPADETAAEELKKIVDVAKTTGKVVKSNVADCLSGEKFTCATNDKCADLACAKGTECTVANQAVICASEKCEVKEGAAADAKGKCNSSSVVGYVVAVVAVVAAFVF